MSILRISRAIKHFQHVSTGLADKLVNVIGPQLVLFQAKEERGRKEGKGDLLLGVYF